jgi:hypothetical protein
LVGLGSFPWNGSAFAAGAGKSRNAEATIRILHIMANSFFLKYIFD